MYFILLATIKQHINMTEEGIIYGIIYTYILYIPV